MEVPVVMVALHVTGSCVTVTSGHRRVTEPRGASTRTLMEARPTCRIIQEFSPLINKEVRVEFTNKEVVKATELICYMCGKSLKAL